MRIYPVLAFLGAAALSLPALAGPSVAPPSAGVHAAVGQRATPSVSPLRWDEVRHMHGAYLLTDGRTVTITSEGRTLFADLDGRREELVRVGESRSAPPAGARPVFPAEFLERQRERLQVKKLEILAMYQKDLKSGQESNDSPTEDLVDRANNAYTRELAFSISDSERELMHQIDLAIERLQSGSYGFCLHTGQQIGQARLEAIPWAKYSVEAQELLEKGLLSEA